MTSTLWEPPKATSLSISAIHSMWARTTMTFAVQKIRIPSTICSAYRKASRLETSICGDMQVTPLMANGWYMTRTATSSGLHRQVMPTARWWAMVCPSSPCQRHTTSATRISTSRCSSVGHSASTSLISMTSIMAHATSRVTV